MTGAFDIFTALKNGLDYEESEKLITFQKKMSFLITANGKTKKNLAELAGNLHNKVNEYVIKSG